MRHWQSLFAGAALLLVSHTQAEIDHSKHLNAATQPVVETRIPLSLPDIELTDQAGAQVKIMSDVAAGKVVLLNTIFTSCTTICTPMGATYAALQRELNSRLGADVVREKVALVSVSIDPLNDTPARLQAWQSKFDGQPGWTLLTGKQKDVETLLKAGGLYAANVEDHSPVALLGRAAEDDWLRISALSSVDTLADRVVAEVSRDKEPSNRKPVEGRQQMTRAGEEYFTNVELTNQFDRPKAFYKDLLHDKVVVINSFFTSCQGSCPVVMGVLSKTAEQFSADMGKRLHFVSISLDPARDTPQRLSSYAMNLNVGDGWELLTGEAENVNLALKKVGHYAGTDFRTHNNTVIIGNEATGLWKKAFPHLGHDALAEVITSVLEDSGEVP